MNAGNSIGHIPALSDTFSAINFCLGRGNIVPYSSLDNSLLIYSTLFLLHKYSILRGIIRRQYAYDQCNYGHFEI